MKVSVGNDVYNLNKYDKKQLIDVTEFKSSPDIGSDLLPKSRIENLQINNGAKVGNFLNSTVTSSQTGLSGAESIPPIGSAFMYIGTGSNNLCHEKVFNIWERTDFIQSTSIRFHFEKFSSLTNDSLKSMGRFRIQLSLEDSTCSTCYNIPKNDRYSYSSTQWTELNLNFTVENYGTKLISDQIGTPQANIFFSNITITHSVY